jgi:hypothetical protein
MLQLSFNVFGLLAVAAYLTIYKATNLGVTSSAKAIRSSFTLYTNFTSPILSDKKGMSTATDLLLTFSLFFETTLNKAIASLTILMLDSFQSLSLYLTNLQSASIPC